MKEREEEIHEKVKIEGGKTQVQWTAEMSGRRRDEVRERGVEKERERDRGRERER